MKRTLLVSVAAVALAAGSTLAFSQQGGQQPGASGGASGTMNAQPGGGGRGETGAGVSGGSEMKGGSETKKESPAVGRGAQDRTTPAEKQQKSSEQAPSGQTPASRQSQGERDKSGTSRESQAPAGTSGGTKQGAAEKGTGGSMTSSNVSLTTEQKTTIRSKVLTSSAPRVTSVNFDVRVGSVVPRTVRIVPVPVTLVEIHPAWRGFMYFVYNDEIIIVDPKTLEIVTVLVV